MKYKNTRSSGKTLGVAPLSVRYVTQQWRSYHVNFSFIVT